MKSIIETGGQEFIVYSLPVCKKTTAGGKEDFAWCDHTKELAMTEMRIISVDLLYPQPDGVFLKISLKPQIFRELVKGMQQIMEMATEPENPYE